MAETKVKFNWPVAGHSQAINFLQKVIVSKKIAQAYLFIGAKFLGKDLVAKLFAQSLFCLNNQEGVAALPCGKCNQCLQFQHQVHPDFIYLSPDNQRNITIDQIRLLIDKLALTPAVSEYKIAIINGADKLEEPAANALLKTLEDPTESSLLILLADNYNSVLPTIISRCQVVNFYPVENRALYNFWSNHEKINQAELKQMVRASQGMPGKVALWLQHPELWNRFKSDINDKLDLLSPQMDIPWNLHKKLFKGTMSFNEKMVKLSEEIDQWMLIVRDMVLVKLGLGQNISFIFAGDKLQRLAFRYRLDDLLLVVSNILQWKKNLPYNIKPDLILDNIFLKLKSN